MTKFAEPEAPCDARGPDLSLLGYQRPIDFALVKQAADQEVELRSLSDEIRSLKSQRRWLVGGVAALGVGLAIMIWKRRKPAPAAGIQQARTT